MKWEPIETDKYLLDFVPRDHKYCALNKETAEVEKEFSASCWVEAVQLFYQYVQSKQVQ